MDQLIPTNSTSSTPNFRFKSMDQTANSLSNFLDNEKGVEIAKDLSHYARTADNYTSIYLNQVDIKYLDRKHKMRMKKAIIINKVFDLVPLVGEILALVNIERINLLMCRSFILKEINLLKKYLIMWDANSNFVYHSAKVLFTMLTCNEDTNRLRFLLNELMEGLCKGDDRSIRIFKEIIITVLIDTLLKTRFYYYDDIQAKFNLVRVFNKGFGFRSIVKIKFVEAMNLTDEVKEKLTFIIMKLDTQSTIDIELDNAIHAIPPVLAVNKLAETFPMDPPQELPHLTQNQKNKIMSDELDTSINNDPQVKASTNDHPSNRKLSDLEAKGFINQVSLGNKFRFSNAQSHDNNTQNPQTLSGRPIQNQLELKNTQVIKLSEYKDKLKIEYLNKLLDETFTDMPKLFEPMPFYQKGYNNRTIYPRLRKHLNNMIRINEFLDMYPPKFVRMNLVKNDIVALRQARFKEREEENLAGKRREVNQRKEMYKNKIIENEARSFKFKSSTEGDEFADMSFKILSADSNNVSPTETPQKSTNIENPHETPATPSKRHEILPPTQQTIQNEIINHQFSDSREDMINQLKQDPATKKLLEENSNNANIVYVPEIHSVYQRDVPIKKMITVNEESKIY